ncbi:MAG: amidase [Methylocella sp.]
MADAFGAISVALDVTRRNAGAFAGVLSGKTFVVKENIDVAGYVSRNGNPSWAASHSPAALDAPAVDRLLAAGARLVGKTQMDEMAYSLLGANHHYGTPVNPAAKDRYPGGSSSGSAVAVAAGLADFALGTDAAGSCRAPAAFCGVYGFRPSHGAVPSNGVIVLGPTHDVIGWLARDIAMLTTVAGILLPADIERPSVAGAICLTEAFAYAEPALADAAEPALAALRRNFAMRQERLGEDFWSAALTHFRNLHAFEAWETHGDWIRATDPEFGPGIRERFQFAAAVSLKSKREADAFRREACEKIDDLLGASACFVVPTTPFAAPLLNADAAELETKRKQMVRIFLLASFFGLPQISIPLKTSGAPLALSLVGRRWSDKSLLNLARRLATPPEPGSRKDANESPLE